MRYTEVRLTRLAGEMLGDDIDKETVDWTPNYDGSLVEPMVLPAKFPNLLVNGSAGIAVGMATNIPPHNLAEVIDATIELIEHPDATLGAAHEEAARARTSRPPASSTAPQGIRDAYKTGRGTVQVRARADRSRRPRAATRKSIVVTEIPYQVNKAKLIERIAELVNEKKIEGIADLRDESDREGMRDRRRAEARRERPGHPQQALRADADAVDLRHHLPRDRREPAARPAARTTCCGTSSTTARRSSSGARSST